MSSLKVNQWFNPDGSENFKCRAFVNFNGVGVIAIRASGNVSSITDLAVGDYRVNFVTAMPDVNYTVVHGSTVPGIGAGNALRQLQTDIGGSLTTSIRMASCLYTGSTNTQGYEDRDVHLAIFR